MRVRSRGKVGASATLSGNVVRVIVADAAAQGRAEREILERFDVPREAIDDVEARVPANVLVRLWEGMPKLLGDPCYGVHLGERAAATSLPVVGRLFASCATVGEGIERIVALQRVFNDVHRTELVVGGGEAALRVRTADSPLPVPRHAMEFVYAWMVVMLRQTTGSEQKPLRARFEVSAPERDAVAEHRRVLGCSVEFGAEYNELVYPSAILTLPNKSADPELREILESHARSLVERLPERPAFASRVAEVLATRLPSSPSVEDVAAALHMSTRTVQRYLQDEGTTFADVLDTVRRRRAEIALRETDDSIAEVSAALGFGDQSAFHKAFVRWTGKTPGAFRKNR